MTYNCVHCHFETRWRLRAKWHRFASKGYIRFNWEIGSFQGLWRRVFYMSTVTGHLVVDTP